MERSTPVRFFFWYFSFLFFFFAPGNSTETSLVTAKHDRKYKITLQVIGDAEATEQVTSTRWRCRSVLLRDPQPLSRGKKKRIPHSGVTSAFKTQHFCSLKTPHRELFMNCIASLAPLSASTFSSFSSIISPLFQIFPSSFPGKRTKSSVLKRSFSFPSYRY